MNKYQKSADFLETLSSNPYPGRGIMVGTSADGKKAVVAYFIMGRSVNSRNRIFSEEPDGIRTEAFDPSKMVDPSLIIYHPVRLYNGELIVTNGDQTDTIRDFRADGKSFEEALRTRCFEPDGPNWTPRISAVLAKDGSYKMSILKAYDEEGSACLRQTFEYPVTPGCGHFLHTYETDGSPIPSFAGEPEKVTFAGELEDFAQAVWHALNRDNKVSLYVAFRDLESGEIETCIINKHPEEK